jgi:4-amino-4-deoxychorismate lyase
VTGNASPAQFFVDGEPCLALPLPDRGLYFGDGLFETMVVSAGRVLCLELHIRRLDRGLERLGFPPAILDEARASLARVLPALPAGFSLRLTVTRGSGERGYAPPEEPRPRIILDASPMSQGPQAEQPPARVGFARCALATQPQLAGIKHLNRLEQVLAARECRESQWDELILSAQDGAVVSLISANLFVARDGELLTPALTDCGIAGTRRQLLLEELAPALGLRCRELRMDRDLLGSADEVIFCNSLRGFQGVGRIGESSWSRHPLLRRIQGLYREYVASC